VHARDHQVEPGQDLAVAVERTVVQDVDLDPVQDGEPVELVAELLVELGNHLELLQPPLP
jgi:hypothetical protein